MLLLSKKLKTLASIAIASLVCIFLFQNCSKYSSNFNKLNSNSNSSNNQNGVTTPPISSDPNSNTKSCFVEGTQVLHGQSRNFYNTQTSNNCDQVKIARNCTNGVISGAQEFKHITCSNNNPDPNPNGQKATSFIFNYFPAGANISPLSASYCNQKYPVGSMIGRWSHNQMAIYSRLSPDGQLYAQGEDGGHWVSTNLNALNPTVNQVDQLCFAAENPANGFRPSQVPVLRGLVGVDQPIRNTENKIIIMQGGPAFLRQCKQGQFAGKYFVHNYSVHSDDCKNGGNASFCGAFGEDNKVLNSDSELNLGLYPKYGKGKTWPVTALLETTFTNAMIMASLGVLNDGSLPGFPCGRNSTDY